MMACALLCQVEFEKIDSRSMKLLWDELDEDGSGFIEMKELDAQV